MFKILDVENYIFKLYHMTPNIKENRVKTKDQTIFFGGEALPRGPTPHIIGCPSRKNVEKKPSNYIK